MQNKSGSTYRAELRGTFCLDNPLPLLSCGTHAFGGHGQKLPYSCHKSLVKALHAANDPTNAPNECTNK
jgi:hypothetical protein